MNPEKGRKPITVNQPKPAAAIPAVALLILLLTLPTHAFRESANFKILEDTISGAGGASTFGGGFLNSAVAQESPPGVAASNFNTLESGFLKGFIAPPPFIAPQNVLAGGGKATVRIVWERNRSSGVLGYNVYRSDISTQFGQKQRINPELLLDPEFIDGLVNPLPEFSDWFYQVEVVRRNLSGQIETRVSDEVRGVEGRHVIILPEIRAAPQASAGGPLTLIRYPISTLNARGITSNDFALLIKFPPIIENVSFETTGLTRSFINLQDTTDEPGGVIAVSDSSTVASFVELNGEGPLLNIRFNVKAGIPEGTTGVFEIMGANIEGVQDRKLEVIADDPGLLTISRTFRQGDIDGDAMIDQNDRTALLLLALGAPAQGVFVAAGDLNGDRVNDISDVVLFDRFFGPFPKSAGTGSAEVPKGGGSGFKIKARDAVFPAVPGQVDMALEFDSPEGEMEGIAGARVTVNYDDSLVGISQVNLIPGPTSFDDLTSSTEFPLLQDSLPPGVVRMIFTSNSGNKIIEGDVAGMVFNTTSVPPGSEQTMVDTAEGQMSRDDGAKVTWETVVELEDGTLFFVSPTPTATPSPSNPPTATSTPTFSSTPTPTETPSCFPAVSGADFDLNSDGEINAIDLIEVIKGLRGVQPNLFRDFDCDGFASDLDLIAFSLWWEVEVTSK